MAKAKPVEHLERVVIRFAGDSGDGMQLTGDRFTSETAVFGNDLATLPDFPAEIRAPAGSLPGVSGFQVHFADHDILTPGDQPNVLVAMNPAALKVNIGDLAKGGTLIVEHGRVQRAEPPEGGVRVEPARGRLARRLPRAPCRALLDDGRGAEGASTASRRARPSARRTSSRSGSCRGSTTGPSKGRSRSSRRSSRSGRRSSRRTRRRSRPAGTTARRQRTSPSPTRSPPRQLAPGTYRQISGNTALTYGLVAASKLSGLPLFLGAYPITPASEVLEELAQLEAVRRPHVPGGGRDRRLRRRARGRVRRCARRDHFRRPRNRPQVRDGRSRRHARATARHRRHPAGRPLDGDADEARAGGPPHGALRAELRVAGARRRCVDALGLLRRCDRGRADRGEVPDAGLPALGRVPRQRVRAVAHPERRRRCPTISTVFATEPNDGERFLPYKRDAETLARPWAIPGTPGLEHRIGGLEKEDETGNVSYDPENHDLMVQAARREGRRHRRRHPRARGRRPGRRGHARPRLGLDVRRDRGGRSARARRRSQGRDARTSATSTRSRGTRARSCGATTRCSSPRSTSGSCACCSASEFLVDAVGYNKVEGRPFRAAELADAITALVDE